MPAPASSLADGITIYSIARPHLIIWARATKRQKAADKLLLQHPRAKKTGLDGPVRIVIERMVLPPPGKRRKKESGFEFGAHLRDALTKQTCRFQITDQHLGR